MNTNWDWANRAIRAIQSLANQWGIDIWAAPALLNDISEENRRQFQLYENSCLQFGPGLESTAEETVGDQSRLLDPFDEFFNAWTYDPTLTEGPFDLFDGEIR